MTLEQIITYPLRGQRVSYEDLARMQRDYANLQYTYDQTRSELAPVKAKRAPRTAGKAKVQS
jgi:hypothetical protein